MDPAKELITLEDMMDKNLRNIRDIEVEGGNPESQQWELDRHKRRHRIVTDLLKSKFNSMLIEMEGEEV